MNRSRLPTHPWSGSPASVQGDDGGWCNRLDEYTGQRFTFFFDPDGLPLELYERV